MLIEYESVIETGLKSREDLKKYNYQGRANDTYDVYLEPLTDILFGIKVITGEEWISATYFFPYLPQDIKRIAKKVEYIPKEYYEVI